MEWSRIRKLPNVILFCKVIPYITLNRYFRIEDVPDRNQYYDYIIYNKIVFYINLTCYIFFASIFVSKILKTIFMVTCWLASSRIVEVPERHKNAIHFIFHNVLKNYINLTGNKYMQKRPQLPWASIFILGTPKFFFVDVHPLTKTPEGQYEPLWELLI